MYVRAGMFWVEWGRDDSRQKLSKFQPTFVKNTKHVCYVSPNREGVLSRGWVEKTARSCMYVRAGMGFAEWGRDDSRQKL